MVYFNAFMMWDPFNELKRMRKEFERLMTDGPSFPDFRTPLTDIEVEDDEVKVSLEIPGVDKEGVELNVTETELEIKADKIKSKKEKDKGYYKRERRYAGFYRLIPLPVEVVPEETEAEFEDGVLEVELKRSKPDKRKKKSVKVKVE